MRALRHLALALLVLAVLLAPGSAAAQDDCPRLTVLDYGPGIYRGEPLPQGTQVEQGAVLGEGVLDAPGADDPCERRRSDVTVVALEGIEPDVAVAIQGRPSELFILGSKCDGFEGDARLACLSEPLELAGRRYIATRYRDEPGPTTGLELGEPIAGATIAGEPVEAVELDGIDPSVAVGLAGDPETAYVAIGVCVYERFDRRPLYDDLRRCLEAPFWLGFEPTFGAAGDGIAAEADRAVPQDVVGGTISLVRSAVAADVVPDDAVEQAVVATVSADTRSFPFVVPEGLGQGRYEAVLTAPDGERTPAGSFLVLEEDGNGPLLTIVAIIVGLALVGAVVTGVFLWRRGRAAREASSLPEDAGR